MRIQSYKIVILAAACISCATAVHAQPAAASAPAPLNLNAQYQIDWAGFRIGRINVTATENAKGYALALDTKTSGVAKLFSDEKTIATVEGHGGMGKAYIPSRYESKPQKEDAKGRHTSIQYDNAGHIAQVERVPGDDPAWRPVVSTEEARGATDPITAGFILRQKLYANQQLHQRETSIKTYDGARLAEMKFHFKDVAKVGIMDSYREAMDLVVSRLPINGYTPKEKKKFAAGDPEIHLYFSNDTVFIPLKATVNSNFGMISATLVRDDTKSVAE